MFHGKNSAVECKASPPPKTETKALLPLKLGCKAILNKQKGVESDIPRLTG